MKFSALQISAVLAIFLVLIPNRLLSEAPVTNSPQAISASYGKLPLNLEANQGQTDSSVQFLAHGQGYTLFLRQGEAMLALHRPTPGDKSQPPASESQSAVVALKLIGGNSNATVSGEDRQITRTNYFLGNDPARWRTDIPNYGRVRYHSVYDGIDLVYYGNQRRLEHDFIVASGADPAKIALKLQGANSLHIDPATGDLILAHGTSELRLLKPVACQKTNGKRIAIASSYRLLAKDRIGFTVAHYNHAEPLTIDPVFVYSTYLGGSSTETTFGHGDVSEAIAVDGSGNAYVTGYTWFSNFPVTDNAFQTTNHAAGNYLSTAFVTKLNSRGTALVYSTFLGGRGSDYGNSIALDASGDAFVAGSTGSSDFPVTSGVFQTAYHGMSTAFITELNPTGTDEVYSSYLGGSGGDTALAVAVDNRGFAYVTEFTSSIDFPVTIDVPKAASPKY